MAKYTYHHTQSAGTYNDGWTTSPVLEAALQGQLVQLQSYQSVQQSIQHGLPHAVNQFYQVLSRRAPVTTASWLIGKTNSDYTVTPEKTLSHSQAVSLLSGKITDTNNFVITNSWINPAMGGPKFFYDMDKQYGLNSSNKLSFDGETEIELQLGESAQTIFSNLPNDGLSWIVGNVANRDEYVPVVILSPDAPDEPLPTKYSEWFILSKDGYTPKNSLGFSYSTSISNTNLIESSTETLITESELAHEYGTTTDYSIVTLSGIQDYVDTFEESDTGTRIVTDTVPFLSVNTSSGDYDFDLGQIPLSFFGITEGEMSGDVVSLELIAEGVYKTTLNINDTSSITHSADTEGDINALNALQADLDQKAGDYSFKYYGELVGDFRGVLEGYLITTDSLDEQSTSFTGLFIGLFDGILSINETIQSHVEIINAIESASNLLDYPFINFAFQTKTTYEISTGFDEEFEWATESEETTTGLRDLMTSLQSKTVFLGDNGVLESDNEKNLKFSPVIPIFEVTSSILAERESARQKRINAVSQQSYGGAMGWARRRQALIAANDNPLILAYRNAPELDLDSGTEAESSRASGQSKTTSEARNIALAQSSIKDLIHNPALDVTDIDLRMIRKCLKDIGAPLEQLTASATSGEGIYNAYSFATISMNARYEENCEYWYRFWDNIHETYSKNSYQEFANELPEIENLLINKMHHWFIRTIYRYMDTTIAFAYTRKFRMPGTIRKRKGVRGRYDIRLGKHKGVSRTVWGSFGASGHGGVNIPDRYQDFVQPNPDYIINPEARNNLLHPLEEFDSNEMFTTASGDEIEAHLMSYCELFSEIPKDELKGLTASTLHSKGNKDTLLGLTDVVYGPFGYTFFCRAVSDKEVEVIAVAGLSFAHRSGFGHDTTIDRYLNGESLMTSMYGECEMMFARNYDKYIAKKTSSEIQRHHEYHYGSGKYQSKYYMSKYAVFPMDLKSFQKMGGVNRIKIGKRCMGGIAWYGSEVKVRSGAWQIVLQVVLVIVNIIVTWWTGGTATPYSMALSAAILVGAHFIIRMIKIPALQILAAAIIAYYTGDSSILTGQLINMIPSVLNTSGNLASNLFSGSSKSKAEELAEKLKEEAERLNNEIYEAEMAQEEASESKLIDYQSVYVNVFRSQSKLQASYPLLTEVFTDVYSNPEYVAQIESMLEYDVMSDTPYDTLITQLQLK